MKATLLFVLLMLTLQIFSYGQIQKIVFGVNGLTCSQCSRSVEIELRKLGFVKDVAMDLENTSGTLSLKDSMADIPFEEVARAVKDAGFSLRYLDFVADHIRQEDNHNFTTGNNHFYLLGNKGHDPESVYQLVGKAYMNEATFKKYKPLMLVTAPKGAYFVIPGPAR